MAIQLDENGNIERITQEDMAKEMKALKDRADALAKAQEEGKVISSPVPKPAGRKHQGQGQSSGNNMEELRARFEDIRLDIARLSAMTPGYAATLQTKMEKIEGQMQYVYEYVKNGEEPKKKGWLAALGWG